MALFVVSLLGTILFGLGFFFVLSGFFSVAPNEAMVLQLFGRYKGTVRETGLRWANPLFWKTRISLRLNVFESKLLKVNDQTGTPIEIAAVVVWRVLDTAQAQFHVSHYPSFVQVQSESALRAMALRHPYDVVPLEERQQRGRDAVGAAASAAAGGAYPSLLSQGAEPATTAAVSSPQHGSSGMLAAVGAATAAPETEEVSLRGHAGIVAEELRSELQRRIAVAGLEVAEARISHLAYAPEIAQAMLQRQQAFAVVSARRRIVEGAVGILKSTIEELQTNLGVRVDREKDGLNLSHIVTNLLTVLVSDHHVQPVISMSGAAGSV